MAYAIVVSVVMMDYPAGEGAGAGRGGCAEGAVGDPRPHHPSGTILQTVGTRGLRLTPDWPLQCVTERAA
jgi:hypothetical protein